MQRFVHTVTMLAVLAHALFGCCSHHAHADHPAGKLPALATPVLHDHGTPHRHCGNPRGHDGTSCPNEEHSKGTGCDAGQCAFVCPASPTSVRLSLERHFQSFLPTDSDSVDSRITDAAAVAGSPYGPRPSPVRAHLLNQIFLL